MSGEPWMCAHSFSEYLGELTVELWNDASTQLCTNACMGQHNPCVAVVAVCCCGCNDSKHTLMHHLQLWYWFRHEGVGMSSLAAKLSLPHKELNSGLTKKLGMGTISCNTFFTQDSTTNSRCNCILGLPIFCPTHALCSEVHHVTGKWL